MTFSRAAALRLAACVFLALCIGIGTLALFNDRRGSDADPVDGVRRTASLPLQRPIELGVVTFNIQNLPLVAGDHRARMRGIATALRSLDPDLVGFQEAFVQAHRTLLQDSLASSRLRHFHYFPSATVGSGLLIASAYPITGVRFQRFSRSNPWWKVWEGDWWAGKGAALARIDLPGGIRIDFYNTHAQADYGNPDYARLRLTQMRELAAFINETHLENHPALLVGDLNSRPGDAEFNALTELADLQRAMSITSGIDHIFLRRKPAYRLQVLETRRISGLVTLGEREVALSDHLGYFSRVRISPDTP